MLNLILSMKLPPARPGRPAGVTAMRRHALAFTVLSTLSAPAAADIWDECGDGPNVVMTQCIWERYEAVDKELNAVWKDVLATIAPSDFMAAEQVAEWKARLLAAQRAWVTFKEEDCNGAVAYEWLGGTGANAAVGACLYTHTRARIDDLRSRYLNR
jgi:uncharacterized protein YecT (DUF1311 family)